ncbi:MULTISPECIES: hypothetical protein [unclassified Pseudomonas]|uniref:hypothetical protein n=1 Tax=unclassified Pseudomonas TaxID=196821 RepID=UPI00130059CB|nr:MULTISPECIES: hypothetical protein [unclassified Pseudomonas]QJI15976.1 hypothetical protein HKK58_26575 [Pseudomonas sp. ADAK22]
MIVHFRVLSLVFNRWEGWPLLQAALARMHKAGPATLGDYRTIMRLSQFAGPAMALNERAHLTDAPKGSLTFEQPSDIYKSAEPRPGFFRKV